MRIKLAAAAFAGALLIAACAPATPPEPTPDIGAIRTSAANTVVAELTLTAAFWTPTPLPTFTETPIPELPTEPPPTVTGVNAEGTLQGCVDDSDYGSPLDVNIPDNTEMTPGQTFIKTWKIKNSGTCPWKTGYTVVYGYGDDKMDGVAQPLIAEVPPNTEIEVSVEFKAPADPGTYTGYWRMSSPNGGPFGKFFSVKIIVK